MIKILITDITPLDDKRLFEQIYATLTEERKQKADALKSELKRKQSVAAGWLLLEAEKWFHLEMQNQEQKEFYSNLSHSGNLAACVIADEKVGIDIELTGKVRERVVEKCYSEAEQKQINEAGSGQDKAELFTKLWTRKESAAKLTREGIARIVRKRNVEEEEDINTNSFRIEHESGIYYMTVAAYSVHILPEYEYIKIGNC
jgi:4'-phosphopantetheinyl transferase